MNLRAFSRTIRGLIVGVSFAAIASSAFGHCDGLDGPVVQAAQKAFLTEDVNLVLIWVKKENEAEIKKAFALAVAVRKLGPEARELADRSFFETLVRVHRAGEGAGFSGLKPAGRDLGPAIPAADKALRDGTLAPVMELVTDSIQERLRDQFNAVMSRKNFEKSDVAKGREFVEAYVTYIHFVEGIYEQATRSVHGHFEDGPAMARPIEHDEHGH